MNATTSGSTETGPAARAAATDDARSASSSSTDDRVAAETDRWIVGAAPAYDICGCTYQPRSFISSHTVNASQDASHVSATSVESGGTTTDSPAGTPATIRSTASNTEAASAR